MAKTTVIRFLYTLRGIDCEFEVVKQHGADGWLCRVIDGPMIGEELVFKLETIRLGQLRLSAQSKRLAGAGAAG